LYQKQIEGYLGNAYPSIILLNKIQNHVAKVNARTVSSYTYTNYAYAQNDKEGVGKIRYKDVLGLVIIGAEQWDRKETEKLKVCRELDADKDGLLELIEVCTRSALRIMIWIKQTASASDGKKMHVRLCLECMDVYTDCV
jgi:hypothetical protein